MKKIIYLLINILIVFFLTACVNSSISVDEVNNFPGEITPKNSGIDPNSRTSDIPKINNNKIEQNQGKMEFPGLYVIYKKNDGLWIAEETGVRPITDNPNDTNPKVSRDGSVVLFTRDASLFSLMLENATVTKIFEQKGFLINEYFVNNHKNEPIFFSTKNLSGKENNDLQLGYPGIVGSKLLLSSGQAGRIYISPNQRIIAISQPGKISVFSPETMLLRKLYQYNLHETFSPEYSPEIVWMKDSSGFQTVIPGSAAKPDLFLFIGVDGTTAKLAEFNSTPINSTNLQISPDGSKVVYCSEHKGLPEIHLVDASTTDLILSKPVNNKFGILGWTPDSKKIMFWKNSPEQIYIHDLLNEVVFSVTGIINEYHWINGESMLFIQDSKLYLLYNSEIHLIDSNVNGKFDYFIKQ